MANDLVTLRHTLHREPELSGKEKHTSNAILSYLRKTRPKKLLAGVGGNGVLAVFEGEKPGPEILLRCDMDGIPVQEMQKLPYSSINPGVAHKCGHDGHMAIMAGVAARLNISPPEKGRVLLLFQPAEETGSGARMVLEDPEFKRFDPFMVFALHNLPGYSLGTVITCPGPFAEASRGLIAKLEGKSSHAGEPLLGISPAPGVASLINHFEDLCRHDKGILVTLIHALIGEKAFGTSPGNAVVMATLRAPTREIMNKLSSSVLDHVKRISTQNKLSFSTEWTEEFPATVNSPEADSQVRTAAESLGLEIISPGKPFPWSEDFGHFTEKYSGALFGLGAGIDVPPLHNPSYDFPDRLIETGVNLFTKIIERTLGFEK